LLLVYLSVIGTDEWLLVLLLLCFQVSRPEDWDKAADPKKFFVQFFGTKEM
jgi:hypothetical protein